MPMINSVTNQTYLDPTYLMATLADRQNVSDDLPDGEWGSGRAFATKAEFDAWMQQAQDDIDVGRMFSASESKRLMAKFVADFKRQGKQCPEL